MNVAVSFASEDYRLYVEEKVNELFPDMEYDPVKLLREINMDITLTHEEVFIHGTVDIDEDLELDDPCERLIAKLILFFQKNNPDAVIIGFHPLDLRGNLMAILYVPDCVVFNVSMMR